MQGPKETLVQGLSMLASTRQPGGDGRLSVAEDPLCGGKVQPLGERCQHHGDLLRGGFQTIQWRVASSTERGAASLTAERLDLLGTAMLAISNQRVDVSIGDAAAWVLPGGFSPHSRDAPAEVLALYLTREWK